MLYTTCNCNILKHGHYPRCERRHPQKAGENTQLLTTIKRLSGVCISPTIDHTNRIPSRISLCPPPFDWHVVHVQCVVMQTRCSHQVLDYITYGGGGSKGNMHPSMVWHRRVNATNAPHSIPIVTQSTRANEPLPRTPHSEYIFWPFSKHILFAHAARRRALLRL